MTWCVVNTDVPCRDCRGCTPVTEMRHSHRCFMSSYVKTFLFSCTFASCEQGPEVPFCRGSRALVTLEAGDASIFRCCRAGVP